MKCLNHCSPIYCHGVDPDLDPWLDEILDEPMLLDELDLLVLVLPSSCHGEDDDEFRQKQGVTDFEGLPSFIEQESMSESHASQEPAPEMSGATDDHSSTLDHALLESLFYNEMVMLSASSPSSSNMMAQQLHEATSVTARESPSPSLADATTIAEKEMLQDFGVTASPVMLRPQPRKTPLFTAPATAAVHGAPSNSQVPASDQVSSSLQGPYFSHNAASHVEPLHRTAAKPLQPKPSNAFVPTPALSSEPPVSQERAKQLVDQFATLASRLGIELPNQVLQQLTTAAATNGISVSNLSNNGLPGSDQIVGAPKITTLPQNGRPTMPRSDAIDSIRLTAEQAIATVTKKRSPERQDSPTNSSGNANGNKPLYSKRRKKPRLSDCESKLAQLKAENEVLKRHLQNVSNKAHQIEQGKEESAKLIKQLHDRNADTDEMENVVKDMTDTYSDYGVNRQQELSFHLEQLSRLVIPTNFTKLGLWTLGQSSSNPKRNPIAGILQKELDITPLQARKIFEQSERIKTLCDNLKETLALLEKLKSICGQKTQMFRDRMAKCKEILTSKQTVKLIIWINDHYQLLEQVCPGWGTEHIH